MRRTLGWTGFRTSVVALGLVAAATGVTRADSMTAPTSTLVAYDTVGSTIGTTGITGTPSISFVPQTGGAFMSPSTLNLGMFEAAALPAGQMTTYNNTPFDIKFKVDGVNGNTSFMPNGTPVDLTGTLNGTLTGASQSSVVATFDSPATAAFATGLYSNTLAISNNPVSIVPSTSFSGMSTVQAMLTTQVTPATPGARTRDGRSVRRDDRRPGPSPPTRPRPRRGFLSRPDPGPGPDPIDLREFALNREPQDEMK